MRDLPIQMVTKTFITSYSNPETSEKLFIVSFPEPRVRYQLDSSPLLSSTNHTLHISLATY
jgi:hypothetical protein